MTNKESNMVVLRVVVTMYFLTSFISLELNPINWAMSEKYFFVLSYLILVIIHRIGTYLVEAYNNNRR